MKEKKTMLDLLQILEKYKVSFQDELDIVSIILNIICSYVPRRKE